jgi:hypothetical protein
MYGTFQRGEKEAKAYLDRYERAKRGSDMAAAMDIAQERLNMSVVDLIIDKLISTNKPALVVLPHPDYDSGDAEGPRADLPKNMLPFALGNRIAEELGCDVDEEIYEAARPGRTGLKLFPRFLWQPCFKGAVSTEHAYILVDDVCTVSATLAMLRSHIVEQGGTVIAVSTLANATGDHQEFPIVSSTHRVLNRNYGPGLDNLWVEKVGHDTQCLTEAEGHALVRWWEVHCSGAGAGPGALQRLRDRLAEAAAKFR